MEGHLTYKIGDTDRVFFFGNYALEETLNHFETSVTDIDPLIKLKYVAFIRIFMFHAASYPILKKGEIPDFTELDIHEWIDKTGGILGDLVVNCLSEINRVLGRNNAESDTQKKSKKKS